MPSQSIIRTFRFFNSHKQHFAVSRYSSVSRCQKSSLISRVSLLFLPSLYFRRSVGHKEEEPRVYDPNLFTYNPERKVYCVIHEDDPEMPEVNLSVTFLDGEAEETVSVKARVGNTVMKAILKYNEKNEKKIPMEAACNGSKACTTCHVYCDEGVSDYFIPPDTAEDDLLDSVKHLGGNSRLCCQMRIMKPFDNIHFKIPKCTVHFAVDKKYTKKK